MSNHSICPFHLPKSSVVLEIWKRSRLHVNMRGTLGEHYEWEGQEDFLDPQRMSDSRLCYLSRQKL